MPALTGTLAQTVDFYPGSGAANQMDGITANSGETVAYLCDHARGSILTLNLATWATGVLLPDGSLTNPTRLVISPDDSTLYIATELGLVYSTPIASPSLTQIADLSAVAGGWKFMAIDQAGAYLYMSSNARPVYKVKLSDGTFSAWLNLGGYWTGALCFSTDGSVLHAWLGLSGPGSHGPLLKINMAQERTEVVAGTSADADANGEAFLVASFTGQGPIAVDTTGDIYAGSNLGISSKIKKIAGGNVSTFYGTSILGTYSHMYVLKTSRKLLVSNGSTVLNVLT